MFVTPALSRYAECRRIGPLSEYVRAVAARPQSAGALQGGVLVEARRYAQQLGVLCFCVNDLMPLLRFLGQEESRRGEDLARISALAYQELERRALELLCHLDQPLPPLESPDVVAAWVGAPCAIVSGTVIPLERVASGTPSGAFVMIRGDRYALRTEEKRPLRDLLVNVRREELRRAERILADQPELTRAAAEFLGDAKSLLDRCRPQDCGRYQLFHHDRYHQLQHSRGHWMLIRGPVATRTGKKSLFVGLPITGPTRANQLAVVPRPSATREGLWTPRGEPAQGRFCMGSFEQYRRLLSDAYFSEAEAVVQWLDAGVILATGRSAFHHQWRELAAGRLGELTRNL
jgi:hypothetical protein